MRIFELSCTSNLLEGNLYLFDDACDIAKLS